MKRVSVLAIICVFLMGLFTPSVFAEESYDCEITIDANKHDGYGDHFAYVSEENSGCEMGTAYGYWNEQGFSLSSHDGYGGYVHDGQIVSIGPGNSNLLIHTIDKKKSVVKNKTETKTESIDFDTIKKNDSSLKKGKTKISQNGKKGVRTITYKVTYTDGKETGRKEVGNKVTTKPVNKVVLVGTKVVQKEQKKETTKKETKTPSEKTQPTHASSQKGTTHKTETGSTSSQTDNITQSNMGDPSSSQDEQTEDGSSDGHDTPTSDDDSDKHNSDKKLYDETNNKLSDKEEPTTDNVVKGELDAQATSKTTVSTALEKDNGESSSSIGWWIGGIIVLVIVGGVGYWLYNRYKKE